MSNQEIKEIAIKDLNLWTENPRDPIETEANDIEIINRALSESKNKWNLQKLIQEMGEHYDFSELPTVVKIKGKYVVYDGNRRIAILKYLQDEDLQKKVNTSLYFNENPTEFLNLKTIPCNVCNLETALKNVERKHTNNGDWGRLERDYFILKHLNKGKTHFIALDEQTAIITNNPKMNKRFVKDEMLTLENLAEIGLSFEKNKFVSNYSKKTSSKILNSIVVLVEENIVSTRNYRGELKKPLIKKFPELKSIIKPFDSSKKTYKLTYGNEVIKTKKNKPRTKKTPASNGYEELFGKDRALRSGKVNDLYLAITKIYEKNENDPTILPIIGMSLRLITEVAARVYYSDKKDHNTANQDKLYKAFLKKAKTDMHLSSEKSNFLSLTGSWLDNKNNMEALLAKYAHGNVISSKSDIIESSKIIGDVLEFYFKKG